MKSALHRFTDYEVRKKKGVPFTNAFRTYLDSVRLRCVNGARAYLTANAKKVVMDKVQVFEDRLSKLSSVWWTPEAFVLDVCSSLEQHGLWPLSNPGASNISKLRALSSRKKVKDQFTGPSEEDE